MTKIHEDLKVAEEALSIAVAKINRMNGGRMPNGLLWIGIISQQRRAVSLLLKLKHLKSEIERFEANL